MSEGKAKPKALKPSIKRLILTRAISDRKVPRELLANQLIREIEGIGEIPPTLETAKRYISAARNTDNPIDRPWSLGACRDYPQYFPVSSIPFLIGYLNMERYIDGSGEDDKSHRFTIRKAIWMVRLESVIRKYIFATPVEKSISFISGVYSDSELASEVMGEEKFDSTELDTYLYKHDFDGFLAYDPKSRHVDSTFYSELQDEFQEED